MNVLELLDEIDMRPCPFCGREEPVLAVVPNYNRLGFFARAECPSCNATMTTEQAYKTGMEAKTAVVRAWNRREWRAGE